jgi:hypothetical protein
MYILAGALFFLLGLDVTYKGFTYKKVKEGKMEEEVRKYIKIHKKVLKIDDFTELSQVQLEKLLD